MIGGGSEFWKNPFGFMFYGSFQVGILCMKNNFEYVCRGRGRAQVSWECSSARYIAHQTRPIDHDPKDHRWRHSTLSLTTICGRVCQTPRQRWISKAVLETTAYHWSGGAGFSWKWTLALQSNPVWICCPIWRREWKWGASVLRIREQRNWGV